MIWMIFALFDLTVFVCVLSVKVTYLLFKAMFYVSFVLPLRLLSSVR